MKRKYIVISMALLSAVSTWAQEITGTVTDALGSPVAGAKVHLVNTPNISAITDRNGVFVLNGEEGDWKFPMPMPLANESGLPENLFR